MNEKFFEKYECIIEYCNLESKNLEEIILENKYEDKIRRCRFCTKEEPEVSFTKISHGISESLGNKRLLLGDECNTCNSQFGETFEDSLGKYIAPFKIVSNIHGKKNRIVHKVDGGSRIEIRQSSTTYLK